ncbi:MAG TPA: alpha-galactosidase [Candidatus Borkfalkia stercoripullorum]|nr:alpha-galactosidase [Candidatus Borkfalkia stercoripullorum]
MNEKKTPPFFLEVEGFEAGHSAAESLTNSAQTAACEPSENGGFMHRASGLRVECPENGFADAPFIVMNAGRGTVTVNHFSRCVRFPVDPARPRDYLIHYFGCCWQAEYQYHCVSFEDADLVPASVHPIVKSFSLESHGSYTTCAFYPFAAVENKSSGRVLWLAFEPTAEWRIEIGVQGGFAYIAAAEIDARRLGTPLTLNAGERYVFPRALAGIAEGGRDGAFAALLELRRGRSVAKPAPAVFNDYMNCLWAQPSAEKEYPLVDAAAEAGAEVFCIDDGWQYEAGAPRANRLGDWQDSRTLFGEEGLAGIAAYIRKKGMLPGLWLEMEVAGENSEIYKKGDDWFLTENGVRVGGGARVFLDFRNPEVCGYIRGKVRRFYDMGFRYIKNDYNDCIQGRGAEGIAYTRAVRAFYESLRKEFPDLIFENCGSGGLRSDYGMLRIFDVQSTSDQEIAANYPSVLQGALAVIPPEKAGIWAYPFPHLYDDFYGGRALRPERCGDESAVFNMVSGMCGAMCLSGRIDRATESGKKYIAEGVACYKRIRAFTASAYPSFPCGILRISEKQKPAVVLYKSADGREGLLFVWRLEGDARIEVPVRAKSAECIYPAGGASASCGETLAVTLENLYTARVFRVAF